MNSRQFDLSEIIYSGEKTSDQNFLNEPVYRFMSFEALLEVIHSGAIPLIKTKYWEDTYENFLFKADISVDGTPFDLNTHQEKLFGSCWTEVSESDALWRIYSQGKCGVRIRSTISKLAHYIKQEFDDSEAWFANIGRVDYLSPEEVVKHFNSISQFDFMSNTTRHFRDSMFMKRKEFQHEREIRIVLDLKREFVSGEVVSLPISPRDVIEEITFDPRISDDIFKLFSSKLELIGFQGISNRSSLYGRVNLKIGFTRRSDSPQAEWLP